MQTIKDDEPKRDMEGYLFIKVCVCVWEGRGGGVRCRWWKINCHTLSTSATIMKIAGDELRAATTAIVTSEECVVTNCSTKNEDSRINGAANRWCMEKESATGKRKGEKDQEVEVSW